MHKFSNRRLSVSNRRFVCVMLLPVVALLGFQIQQIAVAAPSVTQSTCKSQDCSTYATSNSLSCSFAGWIDKKCKFDNSGGTVIWCIPDNTDTCTIATPTTPNKCDGYCSANASKPCDSGATNKCVVNPPAP